MAEFKISRIRYTWRNEWQTSTSYNRDDVIRYGGSSWVCIRQHTSSTFTSDQEFVTNLKDTDFSTACTKMTDGYEYRGEWQSSTLYNLGDIVLYGGSLYLNVLSYTSSDTFDDNIDNWAIYSTSIRWKDDWVHETRYGIGDVVQYGGNVYICIFGHTSSDNANGIEVGNNDGDNDSTLETWALYYAGVDFKGDYDPAIVRYKPDDLVLYNGTVLRCIEGYTSATAFDDTKWAVEFQGSEFDLDWNATTYYGIGSVVRNGGWLFYAIKASLNSSPLLSIYNPGSPQDTVWVVLSKGINFRGIWNVDESYKTGDVVRRGGNLFLAILDTVADGSSLDYLDLSNWEVLSESQNFKGFWQEDQTYAANDVVTYLGNTYACNFEHESSVFNFPGDNGEGFVYWDLILQAAAPAGLNSRGDLLTYDLSRDNVGDGSSFGPTAVELGNDGQVLTINNEDSLIYKDYAQVNRMFYVDPNGVDDTTDAQRGISPFKPWKTVRFACEQADDGFSGTTTIHVSPGTFEEILPIIIPAKTVVLGSELRSTTIKAAGPVDAFENDFSYRIAALSRISQLVQSVIAQTDLSLPKTSSNPLDPVTVTETIEILGPYDPPLLDVFGEEQFRVIDTETRLLPTDAQAAIDIQELVTNITNYITFYIEGSGEAPELVGTNTAVTTAGYENARTVLLANKEFFAEEVAAFIATTYPDYDFDMDLYKRDVRRYIDAFAYDIIYTGNYKSILEGRYYRNTVLGSLTEDMFYCRDTTGVRNCTFDGLSGTLNPPNVFDLYRRPTGGSYISLDPGWGPDDDRCWILNRSPYIQGVTVLGFASIGQKIDGALHNGGNKSITSNDFTQVISDGIGAYVLNNGRAELVSVFTYYAAVGYLAEDGGIIRATNGNCSYGRFGAIADGVDPLETPKTATVNNRNNTATVASAFSGEFVDEIQILEWINAGQEYSQASASFIGAGINAEVKFEDFRDDAVFNVYRRDTSDNPAIQNVGGGGYAVAQNNAQVHSTPGGDATSITIATSDSNEENEVLGKRILLTSGQGTGQYGYITAYNTNTKVVSVSRESDNQPGWDHVVPGTPTAVLNTSTVYRIEPRPIFSDPGFTATEVDSALSAAWVTSIYGETSNTFTGIAGDAGTGEVIEDDGLSAITATFDIVKTGREYEVTLNNAGAGYAVDDEITIEGNLLDGATPDNDITINVTATTDDSTNSIVSFTYSGVASSGNFVVLSTNSAAGQYSPDGESWTDFQMPSTGNWKRLAAGDGTFVAIREDSNLAASSNNGYQWTSRSLPGNQIWNSVTYGDGIFVAVAGDDDAGAISTNGTSWTATTLPNSDDSTFNEWVDITYGKNKFVALANSNNVVAEGTYDPLTSTITWESHIMDTIADSSQRDWISIAYGNNRFVAISTTGEVAYSFDASLWYPASMPTQDGSTSHYWREIRYAQGVFFAVGDTGSRDIGADISEGPTTFAATSFDGISWVARELETELNWRTVAFGNPYIEAQDSSVGKNTPIWIAAGTGTDKINKIKTGARALGRVTVSAGQITQVRLWDPGSGYLDPPSLTVVDPNKTSDVVVECRMADGVLSEPSWINRGLGYRTASTRVTISGNGFADVIPISTNVTLSGLDRYPGPGTQIQFSGNSERYSVVTVTELGQLAGYDGLTAEIRITPELRIADQLEHNTTASLRERYAQCRITGHDFLDIGTGNFEETNYPALYQDYLFTNAPENEVYELDGGRVFYTSTDQSGNFRTGELFAVEQSTGIVTISSDFFDLDGLSELRLGGIRVGGSGVVIREFSTDATFTEDSNNVVPTQRAIAAYLASRLSLGGSEIATASFIAGTVRVGPDFIGNTAGLKVVVPVTANFEGANSGIRGSLLAQTMFYKSFGDDRI